MGVAIRRWVWLECIGMVSAFCCKEVYRFSRSTYPYSTFSSFFCSIIPTSLFI